LLIPLLSWGLVIYLLKPTSDITKGNEKNPIDFLMYVTGARIAKDGKLAKLYDYETQFHYQDQIDNRTTIPGILGFRTPPTTALLYALLPLTDLTKSYWIATAFNVFFIVGSILILNKHFKNLLFVITVAPLTSYIWMTLVGAQLTGIILFLFSTIYILLKNEKYKKAGFVSALLFIKPNFFIAIPLILAILKNKKAIFQFLSSFISTFIVLLAVNIGLYGPNFLNEYIPYLLKSENIDYGTNIASNMNISGLVASLLGNKYSVFLSILITFITYILVAVVLYKEREKLIFDKLFLLLILAVPILNLHTMISDLAIYIIPLSLMLDTYKTNKEAYKYIYVLLLFFVASWINLLKIEWTAVLLFIGVWIYLVWKEPRTFKAPTGEIPSSHAPNPF
jgi:hypothetical protein